MTKGWHASSVQFPRYGVITDKTNRPDILDYD